MSDTITEIASKCDHPLAFTELLCVSTTTVDKVDYNHSAVLRCMKCGSEFKMNSIYKTPWSLCDFSEIQVIERANP